MQPLYESVLAILKGDNDLDDAGSLHSILHVIATGDDDPRIYKTSVQAHTLAANSGTRWITMSIASKVAEDCEQIEDVQIVEFVIHVWVAEDSSEMGEYILERVQDLLDGAALATADLLAWYCRWLGDTGALFEPETRTWHLQGRYTCMVMEVGDLP